MDELSSIKSRRRHDGIGLLVTTDGGTRTTICLSKFSPKPDKTFQSIYSQALTSTPRNSWIDPISLDDRNITVKFTRDTKLLTPFNQVHNQDRKMTGQAL
ncbi:hypothetical protein PV325_006435 [Microctonus aethiopoides]|nr:hypothetical protein PV325_006435 [Microctonus aethiopoides]